MLKSAWRPAVSVAGLAVIAGFAFGGAAQAELVQKQCSVKYQSAKAANSLNGETWNQFYKQCSAELKGGGGAATSAPATTSRASAGRVNLCPAPGRDHRDFVEEEALVAASERGHDAGRPAAGRVGQCGVPLRHLTPIQGSLRRAGAVQDLRRPISRQQGDRRQRRAQMDPEGRRLLQRVQQAPEGRVITRNITART